MICSKILKKLSIGIIAIGLVACSDSATDTDIDTSEPPQLPEFKQYQPDTDYFNNSNKQKSVQAGTGYSSAAQLVQNTVDPLFSSAQVYMPFFNQAQYSDPTYNDGIWEWTYTIEQSELTAEIRLTAEPNEGSGETEWALYVSTSSSEGANFEDYRFMSGTTAMDGSQGNWSIFSYEDGGSTDPIVTFNWSRDGEDNYTATYSINTSSTSTTYDITYSEDGPEHSLEVVSEDGEHDLVIFWNTDTGAGYIDRASEERICWDAEFNNVSCQ